MEILIKNSIVIDSRSLLNGKKVDIYIKNGKIESIGTNLKVKAKHIIEDENLHTSIGWLDMRANFQDPGFEYKEDLISGIQAAANGGFTGVVLSSETNPAISSKAQVEYILNKTQKSLIDVFPMGTVSENGKGERLAEMYDMRVAGAVGFSDGKKSISDSGLLLRALLYVKGFNSLVANFPNDSSLVGKGIMHEGVVSTSLGLKGIPAIAESNMVARDLHILEYTGSKLHISAISTEESVKQIKSAKSKNLNISTDVAAHNLDLTDENLKEFDSHYKVMPPLRSAVHVKSLIKGLKEGTIDVICSDHCPEDI